MMLPMVETFFRTPVAELSLSPSHFLNVFNILKSSPLLRQTFLEIARSHLEPNQGNRVGITL
jgi:hypothetical protein